MIAKCTHVLPTLSCYSSADTSVQISLSRMPWGPEVTHAEPRPESAPSASRSRRPLTRQAERSRLTQTLAVIRE